MAFFVPSPRNSRQQSLSEKYQSELNELGVSPVPVSPQTKKVFERKKMTLPVHLLNDDEIQHEFDSSLYMSPAGTKYNLTSPNMDQKQRSEVLTSLQAKLEKELVGRMLGVNINVTANGNEANDNTVEDVSDDENENENENENSQDVIKSLEDQLATARDTDSLDCSHNSISVQHISMLNSAVSKILESSNKNPFLPTLSNDVILESKVKTPYEALNLLKEGNKRFLKNASGNHTEIHNLKRKVLLHGGQKPHSIIVTCSDSRVPPEMIFDQGLGDLFVIRLAGNVIDTYARASILYAVNHLNAPLVMVMGHEKCGAVGAALATDEDLVNEPKEIKSMVKKIRKGFNNLDIEYENQDARVVCACVQNVDYQVYNLMKNNDISKKLESGELVVKGGYYDFNGSVTFFEN